MKWNSGNSLGVSVYYHAVSSLALLVYDDVHDIFFHSALSLR